MVRSGYVEDDWIQLPSLAPNILAADTSMQARLTPAHIAREQALLLDRGAAVLTLDALDGLDGRDVVAQFDVPGALPEVYLVGDRKIGAGDVRHILRRYVGGGYF